ncbi:MAG: D-alanyl-D-alanine carboxypeptidase/D-alanyl-D-alanine-endopeptidase [Actinobacteria bacterium]|nr:D-alanyl-D-alanine carboxypeptidase/D-alanyl-D-alanine-endopeptidase [Actinomycetota bacterium]
MLRQARPGRRLLLAAGLLALSATAQAGAAPTVAQRALDTWTSAHPNSGVAVWRLDPGRTPVVVAEHRPESPMIPASVMKVVTSTGALLGLGPGFRFTTTVSTTRRATTAGGVLRGPLFLTGAGDPLLSTPAYSRAYLSRLGGNFTRLPAAVRRAGVRRITGPIVVDATIHDRQRVGRGWRSYYTAYSPPLSGLTLNQSHLGDRQGAYAANPERTAGLRLAGELHGLGVTQRSGVRTGRTPTTAVVLGQVTSPRLSGILRVMNTNSDNFIAEMIRKNVGAYAGAGGTSLAGNRATSSLLARHGLISRADRLVDGSGLSRNNRLTANTLVGIFSAANAEPRWGRALINSLATGGSGTLIRRFTAAGIRDRVHAKTGYIDGVSGLAGVVDSPRGVRYAFAFLMNDWDIGGAKATQDRIVTLLASGRMDPRR